MRIMTHRRPQLYCQTDGRLLDRDTETSKYYCKCHNLRCRNKCKKCGLVSNISYHSKKFPQHSVIYENTQSSEEEEQSMQLEEEEVFNPALMCVPVSETDKATFHEPCPYLVLRADDAEAEGVQEGDVCLLATSASVFTHVTRIMEAEKDSLVVYNMQHRADSRIHETAKVYYIQKPIELDEPIALETVSPHVKELSRIKHAVGAKQLLKGLIQILEE